MGHINQDVPDELHREAKAAAALRGISLKEFVTEALRAAVVQATEAAASQKRPPR